MLTNLDRYRFAYTLTAGTLHAHFHTPRLAQTVTQRPDQTTPATVGAVQLPRWQAMAIILAMAVAGFLLTTWLVRRFG